METLRPVEVETAVLGTVTVKSVGTVAGPDEATVTVPVCVLVEVPVVDGGGGGEDGPWAMAPVARTEATKKRTAWSFIMGEDLGG